MFLLLIKLHFLRKMVFLGKLKLIPSSPLQHYNNCSAPTSLFVFKNFLAPPPFKREGRDYALYMRDYKGEKMKLPFYIYDKNFYLQNFNVLTFDEN